MKTVGKFILVLLLVGVPVAARWFIFYPGRYTAPEVSPPAWEKIEVPTAIKSGFEDNYEKGQGAVLFDRAHENNYTNTELNALLSRLTARGYRAEFLAADDNLAAKLRYANAMVVIAPAQSFTDQEIQKIEEFVGKGGKLLLITDPTRFTYVFDDYGFVVGLKSDALSMNSLAAVFGIVFEDDYLYNMVTNEGNYQNIILQNFPTDHPLTANLNKVVFYAAHSISSQQDKLMVSDEDTHSSLSEQQSDLALAVLGGEGKVLALSDLTFMTEPYNAVLDNNQLVSNITDFLTRPERRYPLVDFPYFFAQEVDLVYAGSEPINSAAVEQGRILQQTFQKANRQLIVREKEDRRHDTLFIGLYGETEAVDSYLANRYITLIPPEEKKEETETATATATTTATRTIEEKSTKTPTPLPETEATPQAGGEGEEEEEKNVGQIEIKGIGQLEMNGTALLYLEEKAGRHVLIALASTEEGLTAALGLLAQGDLAHCLLDGDLAFCPTGEFPLPAEGEPYGETYYEETPMPEEESPVLEETPVLEDMLVP